MINVATLKRLAAGDKAQVKENLSIIYVMERAGHQPASLAHGRLSYLSPFRPDTKPSFDVWMSVDGERAGDFAEDWSGDVLDVLKRFAPSYSFPRIMEWASRLLREQQDAGWVAPLLPTPQTFDVQLAAETLGRSLSGNLSKIQDFLITRTDKLHLMSPHWLQEEFRVGALGNRIIVPYFDAQDNLVCYKHRVPGEKFIAAPGANQNLCFYGIWRGQNHEKPVLLCEGETDTWVAAWKVGDVFDVYGIPFGAGAQPNWHTYNVLRGRKVTIAFDGDEAGDRAAKKWADRLYDLQDAPGRPSVTRALLPEGADLASLPGDLSWLPIPS